MEEKIQKAIRDKLEEMREYEYSDGCVLFFAHFCTPQELKRITHGGNGGMLDTLARVLAEEVEKVLP